MAERRIRLRPIRRDEIDLKRLAAAVLAMANHQAETEKKNRDERDRSAS